MYETLKKKYGQNFLIDKNILTKISELINEKYLKIVEIGPGDGRLSEFILKFEPKELKLIEIDSDLIPSLNFKFSNNQNVKIINEDILNYNLIEKTDLVISNLPYNISSQILVRICLMKSLPSKLVLMFQREFAMRLLDKKLNSLNSLVNCFYDINFSFNVSRNSFRPIPKIDSTVLKFSLKKDVLLKRYEIQRFIEFKRNLFSYKRKSLNKILKNIDFLKSNFDLSKRVEELSLIDLLKLFRAINL